MLQKNLSPYKDQYHTAADLCLFLKSRAKYIANLHTCG